MSKPYFTPVVIGEETFDLSHLEPFTFSFESQSAKKQLRIHVTFSNHCFTEGVAPDTIIDGESILKDDRGCGRILCRTRYRLSTQLPGIIQSLNHPQTKVRQTKQERNWVHSITIDDPAGPYHVFFEMQRVQPQYRQWRDLNMRIESAYHEERGGPLLLGRVGFYALCSNVYLGKPVTTKK